MPGIFHNKEGAASAFEGDDWTVAERSYAAALADRAESVFTVGNGFIGARGRLEEDDGATPAVYLNGVYETIPIHYHEKAPGFAEASDVRLPVPSGLAIEIWLGDEMLSLDTGSVEAQERRLDLQAGMLVRRIRWRSPSGKAVELVTERLASLDDPNLMAIDLRLASVDYEGPVAIVSSLVVPSGPGQTDDDAYDQRLGPTLDAQTLQHEDCIDDGAVCGLVQRTRVSGHAVVSVMAHRFEAGTPRERYLEEQKASDRFQCTIAPGEAISLTKCVAYASDRGDHTVDAVAQARNSAEKALADGFADIKTRQESHMANFWKRAAIGLDGDPEAQRAVRFNMFQLMQAVRCDNDTSVAAKGQTGEGYEGHYFWDSEIFALPMFVFTVPDIARSMLVYRHTRIEAARRHARAMGHKTGALFPWRTIGGSECSTLFPTGSAQYHINADIAYAVRQYFEATGDEQFLIDHGAELLFETARIWAEMGFHNPRRDGAFCIHEVTGPDEYTTMVNNNLYTNMMAAAHLDFACQVAAQLRDTQPGPWARLSKQLGIRDEEIDAWRRAADSMFLPYDEGLGIYAQDDSFLDKQVWNFDDTPAEQYPLLLHFHPLTLCRYQVCKQADAVLAMFLLPGRFEAGAVARSFAYYEGVTVHDSTLSPGIFSVLASEIGEIAKAYRYFGDAAYIDLDDLHGNTGHGLHMASMAASWMAVVHGFAGMRSLDGQLSFRPALPEQLTGYRFRVTFRGRLIEVAVAGAGVTYALLEGAPVTILHNGKPQELTADVSPCLDLRP